MPGWNEILTEVVNQDGDFDTVRQKYLKILSDYTGRNVITLYSGWAHKADAGFSASINDGDMTGFMNAVHGMDRSMGLDLVLHTPGGRIGATEAIVRYLKSIFGNNIRALIPHIAMSAGTMIALSCKEILMGRQSSLGPIDPQLGQFPANVVIKDFVEAEKALATSAQSAPYWQLRLMQYPGGIFRIAKLEVDRSRENVSGWLEENMLSTELDSYKRKTKADQIVNYFSDTDRNKAHDRHIGIEELLQLPLNVTRFEADQTLQDHILSVHHATCITLTNANIGRIIENQDGRRNFMR